jgi:hypothetical protein
MPDTQNEPHEQPKPLVDRQEKHAGEKHHEDDQPGGDQRLAARRPSDFAALGSNLLDELEWVRHREKRPLGDSTDRKKIEARDLKATRRI